MLFLRLILSDPDRIQRLFTISNYTIRLVLPQTGPTETCTNASTNGDSFTERGAGERHYDRERFVQR